MLEFIYDLVEFIFALSLCYICFYGIYSALELTDDEKKQAGIIDNEEN